MYFYPVNYFTLRVWRAYTMSRSALTFLSVSWQIGILTKNEIFNGRNSQLSISWALSYHRMVKEAEYSHMHAATLSASLCAAIILGHGHFNHWIYCSILYTRYGRLEKLADAILRVVCFWLYIHFTFERHKYRKIWNKRRRQNQNQTYQLCIFGNRPLWLYMYLIV